MANGEGLMSAAQDCQCAACRAWRKGPQPAGSSPPHAAIAATHIDPAEAAKRSFEPNPDHVEPPDMRRSIHRSHRGEGFNHVD